MPTISRLRLASIDADLAQRLATLRAKRHARDIAAQRRYKLYRIAAKAAHALLSAFLLLAGTYSTLILIGAI